MMALPQRGVGKKKASRQLSAPPWVLKNAVWLSVGREPFYPAALSKSPNLFSSIKT